MGRVVFGLVCAALGYLVALISENVISPSSRVLSVVELDAPELTAPFACRLGEMTSLRDLRALGIDPASFEGITTADDQNMLLVFDGKRLTGVRFTDVEYKLTHEGCYRIG